MFSICFNKVQNNGGWTFYAYINTWTIEVIYLGLSIANDLQILIFSLLVNSCKMRIHIKENEILILG